MEETKKASVYEFKFTEFLPERNEDFYYPSISYTLYQAQSLPSIAMEKELQSRFVHRDTLHMDPPPVPPLKESLSTSSSRDKPKTEEQVNFFSQFKCPECGKGFKAQKSMYGHMRIHTASSRRTSAPKRKSESMSDHEIYTDYLLSRSWGATRIRRFKPEVERNISSELERAASILMEMARSNEKMHMHTCEKCNNTFLSQLALLKHFSSCTVETKTEAGREPSTELEIGEKRQTSPKKKTEVKTGKKKQKCRHKKKAKNIRHVCEVCGKEYSQGVELGGHKRAHFKKKPEDQ
jgi:uncharacterized C2H2 Zn-finger protein